MKKKTRTKIDYDSLIGVKFGRLTVLSIGGGSNSSGHKFAKFRCICGNTKIMPIYRVRNGDTKSCGCLRSEKSRKQGHRNREDLTEKVFSKLTVLRRTTGKSRRVSWECQCECGNTIDVLAYYLKNGGVQSCGCLLRRRGRDSPNWRGGRSLRDGYVLLYHRDEEGNRIIVSEHRCIMEKMLGRPLLSDENVHHKNGVRNDNRPSNLELWTTMQPSGKRAEDLVRFSIDILERYAPDEWNNKTHTFQKEGRMSQKTDMICTRCLVGKDDVKAIQFKQPGKANEYLCKKEHACRVCRDAARGHWRYWR